MAISAIQTCKDKNNKAGTKVQFLESYKSFKIKYMVSFSGPEEEKLTVTFIALLELFSPIKWMVIPLPGLKSIFAVLLKSPGPLYFIFEETKAQSSE